MKLTYENVVEQLVIAVPGLKPSYQHDMDYYGETFPCRLGSYLEKYLTDLLCPEVMDVEQADNRETITRIFDFVGECAGSGDVDLRELILTGFIEGIPPINRCLEEIVDRMRPHTKGLFDLYHGNN